MEKKEEKKENIPRPKVTSLMIMCFVSEVCIRWTVNAFDSRYGIYVSDKFGVTSATFS